MKIKNYWETLLDMGWDNYDIEWKYWKSVSSFATIGRMEPGYYNLNMPYTGLNLVENTKIEEWITNPGKMKAIFSHEATMSFYQIIMGIPCPGCLLAS